MPGGRNKYQSRENRSRIRKLLRLEWDPIGIADLPADEYDAYADKAYVMLMNDHASAEQIAEYLVGIVTVHMGLPRSPSILEASRLVAATMVDLRPEFETH